MDPPGEGRELADATGRAIGAVVVDEDDLPRQAGQGELETLDEAGDVVALVEGGNDDGKLGRRSGREGEVGGRR